MAVDKAYTLTMGGKTWALDFPKVDISNKDSNVIEPNTYNDMGMLRSWNEIAKGEDKPNVCNIYMIRCYVNEGITNAPTVVFDGWELKWANNAPPKFEAGKTYEITIIDNFAMYISY